MKCDRCTQDASIEITVTAGMKEFTMNLCHSCYMKILQEQMGLFVQNGQPKLFDDVLSELLGGVMSEEFDQVDDSIKCTGCGYSMKDIIKKGKFGCEQCYSSFYEEVKKILQSTHSATQHHGLVPQDYREVMDLEKEISSQKAALEAVIFTEEYEKAATIRDELLLLQDKKEKLLQERGVSHEQVEE